MAQTDLAHRIHAIQNTAEVIAQSLKEMIYEAELKPGEPLIQERIAQMFQVSRVPVRDALQLVIAAGLAVSVPRRGVVVRPLSSRHLEELFEVRNILEGAAIRTVSRNRTPELLRGLRALIREQEACLKAGDVKRNEKLDDEFHRALYEAAGNTRLLELILGNWNMIKQARCASTVAPRHGKAWIASSIQRHKALLGALETKSPAQAEAAISENINGSRREISSCLKEMGWIDAAGDGASEAPAPGRSVTGPLGRSPGKLHFRGRRE
jgi:DNA-binding GntR family transcriptional regulator